MVKRTVSAVLPTVTGLGGTFESAKILAAPAVPLELETLAGRFPEIWNPKARPIAAESPAAATGESADAPSAPRRRLSFDEIRERIRRLDSKYREWLDLAAPLLGEEGLISLLQITDREKDVHPDILKRRSK